MLKSGGAYDISGNPLLDFGKLTTQQKSVVGDLFGQNTVQKIVPDGEKLARIPGIGETGIDDLYKVSRTDVDYVMVEYKFVGDYSKSGSSSLGKTGDGLQGSESWTLGSGRLEKSVESGTTADAIRDSVRQGRIETWVVTTRPDGSTELQVLDAMGKPKPVDTSKILEELQKNSGAKS